jgi:Skp family chaperone for outer membrane proteins
MKRTAVLICAAAATALTACAETKIATVDMEEVILAHPQTEENKARLLEMQKEFEKQRDDEREKIKALLRKYEGVVKEAGNEALSEMERNKRINAARDLEQTIKEGENDLRKLVNDLQRKLQEKELLLFGNVMSDVKFAIGGIVKEGGYDLILDKSAFRAGAPVPIVMHANENLDITESVITAIGGKKAEPKKEEAK